MKLSGLVSWILFSLPSCMLAHRLGRTCAYLPSFLLWDLCLVSRPCFPCPATKSSKSSLKRNHVRAYRGLLLSWRPLAVFSDLFSEIVVHTLAGRVQCILRALPFSDVLVLRLGDDDFLAPKLAQEMLHRAQRLDVYNATSTNPAILTNIGCVVFSTRWAL